MKPPLISPQGCQFFNEKGPKKLARVKKQQLYNTPLAKSINKLPTAQQKYLVNYPHVYPTSQKHVSMMATQDVQCHLSQQCLANIPIRCRLLVHLACTTRSRAHSSRLNACLILDAPSDDKEAMLGKMSYMEERNGRPQSKPKRQAHRTYVNPTLK